MLWRRAIHMSVMACVGLLIPSRGLALEDTPVREKVASGVPMGFMSELGTATV